MVVSSLVPTLPQGHGDSRARLERKQRSVRIDPIGQLDVVHRVSAVSFRLHNLPGFNVICSCSRLDDARVGGLASALGEDDGIVQENVQKRLVGEIRCEHGLFDLFSC